MPSTYTIILLITGFSQLVNAAESERRLYEMLLSNYNIYERPVQNHTEAVHVNFQLVLNQFIGLDEMNQSIKLNLWLKYDWMDYNLQWNPADFEGIDDLSIPYGRICVGSTFDMNFKSNYLVYSNGLVTWIPPGIVTSSCILDVTWFPFDEQICHLKFGSWSYASRQLDLHPMDPGWDMSEYIKHGEWDIIDHNVIRTDKLYDCCREVYVDLKFMLKVSRRTLYHGFNRIVPSLLIAVVASLSFALPAESVEKITMEMTIFLAMYLFLDMLAAVTPPTSEALPFMGIFFSSIMILVTTSVVFNIMTLNLHYRTAYKCVMPLWMRKLLLKWIPPFIFLKRPFSKLRGLKARKRQNISKPKDTPINGTSPGGRDRNYGSVARNPPISPLLSNELACDALSKETQRAYRELRLIARDMKRHDDVYARAERDWKFAATVVDRKRNKTQMTHASSDANGEEK